MPEAILVVSSMWAQGPDLEKGFVPGAFTHTSGPGHATPMVPPSSQALSAYTAVRSQPPSLAPSGAPALPPGVVPVPPWHDDPQRLPPGIVLAPVTPPLYSPLMSNPRLANEPPYERLVLISSRVHNSDKVARAVLPNVAYVVYDWKNFTLQELLRYVKKVLGAQKVVSIAVVAPGTKPGTVGLLEGSGTSPDKLATKTELSQFWRVLAGCVALSGTADGRRVDLLGCRVVEAPREGAALLKELWNLTTVPFAAADDALGGYMLCTFMEEPTTKQLSLICSTIPAIDLYFNRAKLLGIGPPTAEDDDSLIATAPPLPPGPPPLEAIVPVGTAPPLSAAPPAAAPLEASHLQRTSEPEDDVEEAPTLRSALPAAVPPQPAAKQPLPSEPGQDVFSRLSEALEQRGLTPEAAFAQYDRDRNGQLTTPELTELMRAYLPDATTMDIKHFQAMLDTDAVNDERLLSLDEFADGLPENVEIQEMVRSGRDDDEVILRLQEYLTDNEQVIRSTIEDFDANGNGQLDHRELQELVACIPGLEPFEKKFVMAYLYHHDQNRDMRLSYDEIRAALDQFGAPAPAVAHAAPPPGAAPAAVPPPLAPPPLVSPAGAGPGHASFASATSAAAHDAAEAARAAAQDAEDDARQAGHHAAAAANDALQDAARQAEDAAQAAVPSLPTLPSPPSALAPLAPLGQPLAPLGGRLAPLAPLGGAPGAGMLPRPGGLAPLAPLR
ncbi:hypothetical protein GPECTOR_22g783 [Gonium pectorale]|uniref:EF-hand domain-containing protein n=1 Tax=Gonium pectorale TaxID=33097 RepID=A0A150GHC7_GONPE|nr:hypothetical protein GPECTOR_22g783 [Gonium pectorale]|eukprot:KXZ49193.1 hypothetical protein GPECTOR_22g783 [Gonium pectorale]